MIHALLTKQLHGADGEFQLDVDLQINPGEFVALYGASGAGKTTLLRCLAGLETPDSGLIRSNNESWFNSQTGTVIAVQQRRVGYMFQDYALFPNMTVKANVEFALRKGANKGRVNELLEMMGLGELQHRKPETLSGGQKQRLALARTLASEPQLLLLDEPLSALDQSTRVRLQDEILRLQKSLGLTTVMVSHDVGEIYKMAQRVIVLESGRLTQQGLPVDVFSRGQTSGKFRFTGEVLAIEPMEVMVSLTILVSNQIVRVVVMPQESTELSIGDKVLLVSKAFNPMVMKLD
jgi:molybdate transport system ATP-binding protein